MGEVKTIKIFEAINLKYGKTFNVESCSLVFLEGYPDACLFDVVDKENNVIGKDYFIRNTDLRREKGNEEFRKRRTDKNGVIPFNFSIQ